MNLANTGTIELSVRLNCRMNEDLPVIETEYSSGNIECDMLGNAGDISIESPSHIIVITEYKCLLHVKANGDDICCIGSCISLYFLDCALLGENVLLIVGQHNNKRYVKDILQPPAQSLDFDLLK
jgi:hypothetical protein